MALRIFIFFSLTILFSGCQTTAQNTRDNVNRQLSKSVTDWNNCISGISALDSYKTVSTEVIFDNEDSPFKYDLLMSKNKLTERQKNAVKEYLSISNNCRKIKLEAMNGLPHQLVQLQYFNALDSIYLKLLKDEITIGEANEAKIKSKTDAIAASRNIENEFNGQLRENHYQEIAYRQRNAEIFMQQQRVNQMQQQQIYQQQMQQIRNNRIINTNCSTFGNYTNCTTR